MVFVPVVPVDHPIRFLADPWRRSSYGRSCTAGSPAIFANWRIGTETPAGVWATTATLQPGDPATTSRSSAGPFVASDPPRSVTVVAPGSHCTAIDTTTASGVCSRVVVRTTRPLADTTRDPVSSTSAVGKTCCTAAASSFVASARVSQRAPTGHPLASTCAACAGAVADMDRITRDRSCHHSSAPIAAASATTTATTAHHTGTSRTCWAGTGSSGSGPISPSITGTTSIDATNGRGRWDIASFTVSAARWPRGRAQRQTARQARRSRPGTWSARHYTRLGLVPGH